MRINGQVFTLELDIIFRDMSIVIINISQPIVRQNFLTLTNMS